MRISDWSSDVCSSDLILDFVSVRGLFKKGEADPKIVVVIAESEKPSPDGRLLHAVFRRNGRATAEQGFDIDYYDLHWLKNEDAERSRDVWRANLLGGSRVHDLRSEEHTSELQSLMRISYAVFCLKNKNKKQYNTRDESNYHKHHESTHYT